ncbi:N-acyl amino acid synthase FeeM domain-containing protein [Streptomyces cinnamoneus]|uniref:N-acyl amino acid synthase FeeM domain-containing protein n=1 Tax=Streptomyces cinnamoneus TaxID=53446 RepID=UPI0037B9EE3F
MTRTQEPVTRSHSRPNAWRFVERRTAPDRANLVYRAKSADDFTAVENLWNAVYGEECGWLRPGDGPRHKDRYDAYSTYLLARVEDEVVGTMRLVRDSPQGLPVEQFVDIDDLREGRRLIECQRLMIHRDYRNKRWPAFPYGVFGALSKACVHWAVMTGMTHILADLFADTKTTPLEPLRELGFQPTGKEFVDTELDSPGLSVAMLLRVGELFSRPFRTTVPFYRYLMEYDESVDVYDYSDHLDTAAR